MKSKLALEDYKELWEILKDILDSWDKSTNDDKLCNEKILYIDIRHYMEILEENQRRSKNGTNN